MTFLRPRLQTLITLAGATAISMATVNDTTHRYGSRRPLDESFTRNEESRRRDRAENFSPREDQSHKSGPAEGFNAGPSRSL
jgi:hypothetical protein